MLECSCWRYSGTVTTVAVRYITLRPLLEAITLLETVKLLEGVTLLEAVA